MENSKSKALRGLFTKEGLFRLVFAAGVVLVVLGTLTLAAAMAITNFGAPTTTATMQMVAMAGLVAGGGTLVGAGMAFGPPDGRDVTR